MALRTPGLLARLGLERPSPVIQDRIKQIQRPVRQATPFAALGICTECRRPLEAREWGPLCHTGRRMVELFG